ncbi:hypothetical protein MGMO_112c00170 [Methyloglobulus morosus KoM1]|uniref:DUF2934 domain-containing protein n=1 Tax=Methyloglobulus morosus KoM1 TaxID=1116472 RepID=V5C387_9GAMM|nr:DUF2934 domain-containing protein [Methyloglobulus morosus]ESS71278.1 hypothetical protein MGMO_112c00170 [Methyloglobulus morosus KoM1]
MSKTIKKIKAEGNSQSKKAKKFNKPIFLPDRDARVAEIAYHKAKNRNFLPGYELDDWLEAGKEFSF